MKKMNKKGFTLVEIMIVVAIIGLLAAIGIPSFQKARANSIAKSMENNVRIVESAVEQYAMENGMASGSVTYADYCAYVKGCETNNSDALDVGKQYFQRNTLVLGTALTTSTAYGSTAP